MANSNSDIVQFGLEDTYGTLPTMTRQIQAKSKDFNFVPNKKEEGLQTGGKGKGRVWTLSKKSEGKFETIARPDDVGFFLSAAFGIENTTTYSGTAYQHVFTLNNPNEYELPSFACTIDRGISVQAYTGCVIDSLSFSASPEDFLYYNFDVKGMDEVDGTLATGLSLSPLKPLRFADSKVTISGQAVANITKVSYSQKNNVSSYFTTDTGLYATKGEAGTREITCDLELVYDDDNEAIRQNYFKEDDMFAFTLEWISEEKITGAIPYSLKLSVPYAQVIKASIPEGSPTKQNLTISVVDPVTNEMITATLIDAKATDYI